MDGKVLYKPYDGKEKFIFASYHPDDFEKVSEIINVFFQKGYRIWYYEEASADFNFVSILSKKMKECECCLLLLSPAYIKSDFCLREMRYALMNNKKIVPVLLEEFSMPDNIAFMVQTVNHVNASRFDSVEEIIGLFEKSSVGTVLGLCRSDEVPPVKQAEPELQKVTEEIASDVISEPVAADDGGKYIFVSYAHRNKELVLPVISRLQQAGYAVWYDNGIDPGTEWDEFIAGKVYNAGYFIAMISEAYLASSNCKDELNFARDADKKRVLVYLESVKLPLGMQMRLGRLQAIHKYAYTDEEEFYRKLFCSEGMDVCRK